MEMAPGALRSQVAEEVRALMGRRRISGVKLAKALGRSQPYVWRRLSGETAFDVDDLQALARILNVSVVDLFGAREALALRPGVNDRVVNADYHPGPLSVRASLTWAYPRRGCTYWTERQPLESRWVLVA